MSLFAAFMQLLWAVTNVVASILLVVGWFWNWQNRVLIGLLILWVYSMQQPSTMKKANG